MDFEFPNVCITIPNFNYASGNQYSITREMASVKFNLAWTAALNKTLRGTNNNTSYSTIKTFMFNNLQFELNKSAPGSSVVRGICNGTINVSSARYACP